MNSESPARLRMFAGPNGSGKTSLVRSLAKEFSADGSFHLHRYLNADDIQAALSGPGLDLSSLGLPLDGAGLEESLRSGGRLGDSAEVFTTLRREGSLVLVPDCDAYTAAAVTDYAREHLIGQRESFAFETVMSHPNKVDFFRRAFEDGYRTYLYFVATADVELNLSRVGNRALLGGHDVPAEKVVARYHRSLELLPDAMKYASRAYLFDNSVDRPVWLAEQTPDRVLELRVPRETLPEWFRSRVMGE